MEAANSMTTYYGVYAQNENDTHVIDRSDGLIHGGGIGSSYVIVSAPLSALSYLDLELAKGSTVTIMGWAEAESTNYHHYAVDTLTAGETTEIRTTLGGWQGHAR